ncbi:hypothetical protein [Burkholderia pyrrocinia]|uniref:hypothetical protein n=1 Tax=Burkholderia pyrrocinia TaxID=60550 RepID=UPI00158E6CF6|nr:hypothetical protein [Burkholderia pyrrocinia]
MKRVLTSMLYLIGGLLFSAFCAALVSRLATQYSWPLISTRWHGCWDTEHCKVSWWGYGAIALFLLGPTVAWSAVGFAQAPKYMRSPAVALALVAGTAVFYLAFYAAVWP